MSQSDKIFAGSIPAIYDAYLVPLIFAGFADEVAGRIAARTPDAVLETATGTGVMPRALAPRLPRGCRYVATDLNAPMLGHAQSRQPPDAPVMWAQADALALPFAEAEFDAVICQFGAMFFPDRVAGYREARRVLRPGAPFVFTVWDKIGTNVFADDVTRSLAEMFPADPPRFLARTPHGHHDPDRIRAELQAAGFRHIGIETRTEMSRAPSAHRVAFAYCHGTPLRGEIEARGSLDAATDRAAAFIEARHGPGEVAAPIQGLIVTATA